MSSSYPRRHVRLLLAFLSLPALAAACEDSQSAPGAPPNGQAPLDAGSTDGSWDIPDADASDGGDSGDAADAGDGTPDAGLPDGGDDAGTPTSGWQAVADVVVGQKPKRTTMLATPDGRVLLAFRDNAADATIRVVRWHGADTAAWDDLGIANAGVAGALETGADPQERFVGLAFAGTQRVVAAFRQNGAVYANVHDGAAWGTPLLLSSHPSAVAVAGDRTGRALVVYRTSTDRVGARLYDAATQTWSTEAIIGGQDVIVDPADSFWVEAEMDAQGDALVVFRKRSAAPATTHDVSTARYSAAQDAWTAEQVGILSGSTQPEHLCLAVNDAGAAVVSLRERFTNQFGTFVRTRAAHRAAAATSWSAWAILEGVTFHDGCAISADGTAIVTSLVAGGGGDDILPHRHASSGWSTGAPIATKPVANGSRFVFAMAAGGRAAGAHFRTDNELRLHRLPTGADWVAGDTWTRVNPISTSLDQHFKGGHLLDDGRFLWIYQDTDGALRYVVHR